MANRKVAASGSKSVGKSIGKVAALLVPIAGGIFLAILIAPYLPGVGRWVESAGAFAPIAFVLLYAAVVVFMLPAFLLIIAGGAVFGVVLGSVLSLAGAALGGVIAFLIARHLARERVAEWVQKRPKLSIIDQSIGDNGLRLVFLLRLSPAVPFVLSNYALGISTVRLSHFVLGTVGLAPVVFAYAAYGAVAGATAANGKAPFPPIVMVIGVLATVVLAVLLTRIVQHALRDADAGGPQTDSHSGAQQL